MNRQFVIPLRKKENGFWRLILSYDIFLTFTRTLPSTVDKHSPICEEVNVPAFAQYNHHHLALNYQAQHSFPLIEKEA